MRTVTSIRNLYSFVVTLASRRLLCLMMKIPANLVVEYVHRAFSTPYNTSDAQNEDEDVNVYEPLYMVQRNMHALEVEEEEEDPPLRVPEPEVYRMKMRTSTCTGLCICFRGT